MADVAEIFASDLADWFFIFLNVRRWIYRIRAIDDWRNEQAHDGKLFACKKCLQLMTECNKNQDLSFFKRDAFCLLLAKRRQSLESRRSR